MMVVSGELSVLGRPAVATLDIGRVSEPIQELEPPEDQWDSLDDNIYLEDEFLLGSLGDGRVRVLRPFVVARSVDGEDVVLQAVEIEEFGFGETNSGSLRDLQRAILELYFKLEGEHHRLGPALETTLEVLRGKLQPTLVR